MNVSERVIKQLRAATVFSNDELLVIDKPTGMAVHSGSGLPWGLIDAVRQMLDGEYVELVHRIDRETSGLLLLARSGAALRHLSEQFREGKVNKRYLCLMGGELEQERVTVNAAIDGRDALTDFRLLKRYPRCSYAEADIHTGRNHQVRIHARELGMPLAGDEKYSTAKELRRWRKRGLRRLFLHAHKLEIVAPGGEAMTFSAPLPEALRRVLDGL